MRVHDVVILGSDPAGLTAALYTARANLAPVVVEGLLAGGQLMQTTEVENYPGFPEGIMGPELMEKFKKQAARFGTTFVPGDVITLDFSKRPFTVTTEDETVAARAVIIATGASAKTLGVAGEKEYSGRGVSYCATCDGFFFRKKEIVVVGGGDTAMEEANFLTRFGSRVTVIHRREEFRASKIMLERARMNPKIAWKLNAAVVEIHGAAPGGVTSLTLEDTRSGARESFATQGLFVAIGHSPNTAIFKGKLAMNDVGYLKVKHPSSATSVEGVFAAGDVADPTYRQAVSAAGEGCKAAIDAERWLAHQGIH